MCKYLLLLTLLFICCNRKNQHRGKKDELFMQNSEAILSEIQRMIDDDQNIRLLRKFGTIDSFKIDSIDNYFSKKNIDIDSVLFANDNFFVSKSYGDSVANIMLKLSRKHTSRIIEMIDQYGYPSSHRLSNNATPKVDPFILLHHPDMDKKDTLLHLLALELQAGRVDSNTVEAVKWDLNGRAGIPNVKGVTIVIMKKDGTTDTIRK